MDEPTTVARPRIIWFLNRFMRRLLLLCRRSASAAARPADGAGTALPATERAVGWSVGETPASSILAFMSDSIDSFSVGDRGDVGDFGDLGDLGVLAPSAAIAASSGLIVRLTFLMKPSSILVWLFF